MVPWFLLIIAAEIGILLGFLVATIVTIFYTKQFVRQNVAHELSSKADKDFELISALEKSKPDHLQTAKRIA
ncbi:MAG TPA: hypothetical protein DDW65_05715 [Firmicutes bacterium]|nr:hypothetical protein [Bacillota bacterium]